MADQLTTGEWKVFLRARILQEQGDDAGALPVFNSLLAAHPRNAHLLASRTYALARLGQGESAISSTISAEYSQAGQALVGVRDKPDQWEAKLNDLLSQLDQAERANFQTVAFEAVPW